MRRVRETLAGLPDDAEVFVIPPNGQLSRLAGIARRETEAGRPLVAIVCKPWFGRVV